MRSAGHPTVSVIIATYNRAPLIARSIQSVLNQSYTDFELLVIDDGSTDDTEGVVAGFRDLRMTYVRLAHNIGVGAARNLGIRISKGGFIAFQDSDDEWLPDNLAQHMSAFERCSTNVGIVYCDMHRMLKDGSVRYHASPTVVPGRLINPTTRFYDVYMLGSQSVVIKRECFHSAGYFNEELPALEDLELFIRLSKRFGFFRIVEPLVRYYETDGLSTNRHAQLLARQLIVKLHYKDLLLHSPRFLFNEWLWVHKTRLTFMLKVFVRPDRNRQPERQAGKRDHAQLHPEGFRE